MVATKAQFRIIDNSKISNPGSALVLVGTALDGPARVPFQINPNLDPYEVLGDCPLAKAHDMAQKAGASEIILYRLNGDHGSAEIWIYPEDREIGDLEEQMELILRLHPVSAHEKYNHTRVDIDFEGITVLDYNWENPKYYSHKNYPTIYDLSQAFNLDSQFGLIEFTAEPVDPTYPLVNIVKQPATVFFHDATEEPELIIDRSTGDLTAMPVLKQRLKEALFGQNVEDQESGEINGGLGLLDFGLICLVDMFIDDDPDFVNILSKFCYNKTTQMNQGCLSVIGTSPLYDPTESEIVDYVNNLIDIRQLTFTVPRRAGGTPPSASLEIDPLSLVQVIVGQTDIFPPLGIDRVPVSLAYGYAGTQASIPFHSSMTNKKIHGITHLSYEISKELVDSLLSNGYISIVGSVRKGTASYYARTFTTKEGSGFRSPHAVRISHYLSRGLSESLDLYVGSTMIPIREQIIKKEVQDVIDSLFTVDMVRDYSSEILFNNQGREMTVSVDFAPYSEVRKVNSVVRLPFGGMV